MTQGENNTRHHVEQARAHAAACRELLNDLERSRAETEHLIKDSKHLIKASRRLIRRQRRA